MPIPPPRESVSEAVDRLVKQLDRLASQAERQGLGALGLGGGTTAGPDAFGVVSLGKGQGYGTLDQTGEGLSGSYFADKRSAEAFADAHRRLFAGLAAKLGPPVPVVAVPASTTGRPSGAPVPSAWGRAAPLTSTPLGSRPGAGPAAGPLPTPALDAGLAERLGRQMGAAVARQLDRGRAGLPAPPPRLALEPPRAPSPGRPSPDPSDPLGRHSGWARPSDPSAPRPPSAADWRRRMDDLARRGVPPGQGLAPFGVKGPGVFVQEGRAGPLGTYSRPIDVTSQVIRVPPVPTPSQVGSRSRAAAWGRAVLGRAGRRGASWYRSAIGRSPTASRIQAFGQGARRVSKMLGRAGKVAGMVGQGAGVIGKAAGVASTALGIGAQVAGAAGVVAGPLAGAVALGAAAAGAAAKVVQLGGAAVNVGLKFAEMVVKLRQFGEAQNQSNRWAAAYNRQTSAAFQALDANQYWRDVAMAKATSGTASTLARATDLSRAAWAPVDTLVNNSMNRAGILATGFSTGIGRALAGPAQQLAQRIDQADPDGVNSYATGVAGAAYLVAWLKNPVKNFANGNQTAMDAYNKAFVDAQKEARQKIVGNSRWESGIIDLVKGGPIRGPKPMPPL